MHLSLKLLTALVLAAHANAYNCTDFIAPVTVTSTSRKPIFPPFGDHCETVNFLVAIRTWDAPTASPLGPPTAFTETFDISCRYCVPEAVSTSSLQILTHGLGFDKSYWDSRGPGSEYSYIQTATDTGHATFSYDSIGNGLSTKPDAYETSQAPIELKLLTQLTNAIHNGTLHSCMPQPTGQILLVGDSYGSVLCLSLMAASPSLSDGVALTGFTTNASWQGQWAYKDLSTGYSTWASELENQYGFLKYPYFNPAVLSRQRQRRLREFLTARFITPAIPLEYCGPPLASAPAAMLIACDSDMVFCGGNCHGIVEQGADYFPAAQPFETYIQPLTGHGMNLHFYATGFYGVVQSFFESHS